MKICLDALDEVYKSMGEGEGITTPRQNLWVSPPKSIKSASAALPKMGYMGLTAYTGGYGSKGSGPSTTLLYDSEDGRLLAYIESRFLSWYRTGATSGIATKYLAKRDSKTISVIGCGRQAKTQLIALHAVLPTANQIRVYSPTRERREAFAAEMTRELGRQVLASNSAESCVSDADVIATITTSKQPVLDLRWLKDGVHICAVGAHYENAREIDTQTVVSTKVIVDSKEQALLEKGEILIPIKEHRMTEEKIYAELGEIVAKKKPGRTSENEKILFCSGGLSIEQVGIAGKVYDEVVKNGRGSEI